jgi:integral membrane protein
MAKFNLKLLRFVGLLEGISFLLLLGVAVPMKRVWHNDILMQPLGLAHGFLFMGYVVWVFIIAHQFSQKPKFIILSCLASILPLGTFVADRKLLKPLAD